MVSAYREGQGLARAYAQVAGVILLVVGVVGLVIPGTMITVLNSDLLEDVVHIVTGGILAYAGFMIRDNATVRTVVGGLGVVYLVVGVLGFVTPNLLGLLPTGYTVFDNVLHLGLGVISIAVAWFIGRETETAGTR
jgi:hypothetical protein